MIGKHFAWPQVVPPAARRLSPFTSWVDRVLISLVIVFVVAGNLWLITERHAAYRNAQRVCAEETRYEIRRKPVLANTVPTSDACATLRRMRGQE